MKLHVRNLGRIHEADLDIRPLTVFVGKNNTNKTWVAYSLYGLLRNLTWRKAGIGSVRSMGSSLMKLRPEATRQQIRETIEQMMKRLPAPRPGVAEALDVEISRKALLQGVNETVAFILDAHHIAELLGVKQALTAGAQVKLEVSPSEMGALDPSAVLGISHAEQSLDIRWTSNEPEVGVSGHMAGNGDALRERARDWLLAFAQRFSALGLLLLLPTEREMLVSTYKQKPDESDREFALMAPTVLYMRYLRSAELQWLNEEPTVMPDVLAFMNDRMLGGTVDFQKSPYGAQLMFIPRGGPALPIHSASALVRSFAGLALYIRYAARAGDTLIIDEPEMNAHPEVQLATIELLALLVNRGVRVVLTTHSPYIVDHLNNLMAARRLTDEKQKDIAAQFHLGSADAFLDSENVAAYCFDEIEPGGMIQAKSIVDRNRGEGHDLIEWETFNRSSVHTANLYGSILDRIDEE